MTNYSQAQESSNVCPLFATQKKIGELPFARERRVAVDKLTDVGLAGRLALDLSKVTPESLATSNQNHFIRTRLPDGLIYPEHAPWSIRVEGLLDKPTAWAIEDLTENAQPMGVHVMECSGNGPGRAFGLLSAAAWEGIPLTSLLKKINLKKSATRVRVSGFDRHSREPGKAIEQASNRGASWIFTFQELEESNAFLATKMNGKTLPKDHGFPVRLLVPGWYGCTCAKWVNNITLVDENALATHLETNARRHFSYRLEG